MKALFVSNDPLLFDEKSAVRARMRAYAALIGELHVVSPAPLGASRVDEGSLHLYPVVAPRWMRVRSLARAARAIIKQESIEIVSAQDPFEHGLAAQKAVRDTKAKLHVQIHTDFLSPWFVASGNWRSPRVPMPLINRYRRRLADRVLPSADGIRVVSERIRSSLVERYGESLAPVTVIPVALAPGFPPPKVPLPPHDFSFALVAVSRLAPEKRIEDVLAALARLKEKYPMVGLFIIGEGSERPRLVRMAQLLGLESRVIFLGWRGDAWALAQSAQAFIQASAYEGYGLSLIEAALAGLPIVTTDVGIVGEVLRGYEEVLATPVADPAALAVAIEGLVVDERARIELPMHARLAAKAHLEQVGDVPTRVSRDLAECASRATLRRGGRL